VKNIKSHDQILEANENKQEEEKSSEELKTNNSSNNSNKFKTIKHKMNKNHSLSSLPNNIIVKNDCSSKMFSPNITTNNLSIPSITTINTNFFNSKFFKKIPLPENEILKRLDGYKKKLMNGLLKTLSEEKLKEEERELNYNKTTNPVDRKKLEKIISMERALSSEKIMKMNE
jgi:hypothetical protein